MGRITLSVWLVKDRKNVVTFPHASEDRVLKPGQVHITMFRSHTSHKNLSTKSV